MPLTSDISHCVLITLILIKVVLSKCTEFKIWLKNIQYRLRGQLFFELSPFELSPFELSPFELSPSELSLFKLSPGKRPLPVQPRPPKLHTFLTLQRLNSEVTKQVFCFELPPRGWHRLKPGLDLGLWTLDPGLWTLGEGSRYIQVICQVCLLKKSKLDSFYT